MPLGASWSHSDHSANVGRAMSPPSIHDRKTFGPGKLLIRPGDPPDQAYLIQSGRARVFDTIDGKRRELATMGPGEIVGDMALIRKSDHLHGVEAIDSVVAVVISIQRLHKALDGADPLLKTILEGMLARIDRLNEQKQPGDIWLV